MSERSRQRQHMHRLELFEEEVTLLSANWRKANEIWPKIDGIGFAATGDTVRTAEVSKPVERYALNPDEVEKDRRKTEQSLFDLLNQIRTCNALLESYLKPAVLVEPQHGRWIKCANPNFGCDVYAVTGEGADARCGSCYEYLRKHGADRRTVRSRWYRVEQKAEQA